MEANRPDQPAFAGVGTFMKVPLVLDTSQLAGADVVICGAPMDDLVTHRPGARFGPRAIRTATDDASPPHVWHLGLGIDPFAELTIVDHMDCDVSPGDPEVGHAALRKMVGEIRSAGAVPIVLGGDHSIAYPNVSAVADSLPHGALTVVHFDTHADTATENWGNRWAHGTPFRHLVDEGKIPGNRLVQIGLRGYWPLKEEWEWARSAGVTWHLMDSVFERGIDAVVDDVLSSLQGAQHVFLSVDVDVLDPAFAPGTGTPEPGGMSTIELLRAIRTLTLAADLVGMEIVEVSPPYDHAGITAWAAQRCALEAISALAVRRSGGSPTPETP